MSLGGAGGFVDNNKLMGEKLIAKSEAPKTMPGVVAAALMATNCPL